jgi:hypothetical protein
MTNVCFEFISICENIFICLGVSPPRSSSEEKKEDKLEGKSM